MIPSKEYGEPHRRYIDPDRMAGECDDQLPLVSKVGRGPRGHGVTPRVRTDQPGEYVVEFVDDVTGEVVLSTANLSAGEISVSVDEGHSPVAGETVMATIHVRLGDETRDYALPIPPGATGSIFFEVDGEVAASQDGTYRVDVGRLASWGNLNRPSRPVPRVNDMVVFTTPAGFAFGTVEAVANGQVVFTSRTGFELPEFGVTDDGHLTVDGKDTGVSVVGPAGKDAVSPDLTVTREDDGVMVVATDHTGITEAKVLDGTDGVSPTIVTSKIDGGHRLDIDSAAGEATVDVMDGIDGENGLPATMVVRSVTETKQPTVNVQRTDFQTNTFSMDFGLPRGADGKSIDIQGGVYKVTDLPDFDSTPINRAFIVSDYEENEDYRYDLYIRGIEPVIAEEGGPWTVVEDWQGMPGFSMRYVHDLEIDPDTPIQVAEADIETTFVPSAHIADGDLVLDDHGHLGVVGSATDGNGYVTVTFVTKLQIHWDDISDKPAFVSTDTVELTESDGTVKADLTDSVKQSLAKADSAIQATDLTAAIQAEAAARDKADKLLETEIDGKLGPEDIVAGKNVSVTHDPDSGRVTIDNTMRLTDSASGYVAHSDDNDFVQKPLEVRVKGRTVKNLWPAFNYTDNGVTASTDDTGLITMSGAAGASTPSISSIEVELLVGKTYTVKPSVAIGSGEQTSGLWIQNFDAQNELAGKLITAGFSSANDITFTVPSGTVRSVANLVVYAGVTVDASFRVMLVEGTEAPDCFTPTGVHGVEAKKLVTAGKNLLRLRPDLAPLTTNGVTFTPQADGGTLVNGTATSNAFYNIDFVTTTTTPTTTTTTRPSLNGQTVTCSLDGATEVILSVGVFLNDKSVIETICNTSSKRTGVISQDASALRSYMHVKAGTTVNSKVVYPQLELGSTATAYEPPNVTEVALPETDPLMDGDVLTVAQNGDVTVSRADGTTDQLVTVQLPQLPAPTFNVYPTGGDVPSDTSVEYLTEDAKVLTRFLMPGNIKAGSNVSVDVDGNDVTVSSSGGTADIDTATDEEFQEYMGY